MKKIKEIKIVNQDGSTELANIGADANNIETYNGTSNLENDLNSISTNLNLKTSQIRTLEIKTDSLANGAPLVASSISEMTDITRIYVNTTDGNWYWYNGTTWVIGGIYQASEHSDIVNDLNDKIDLLFNDNKMFNENHIKTRNTDFEYNFIKGKKYKVSVETNGNTVNIVAALNYPYRGTDPQESIYNSSPSIIDLIYAPNNNYSCLHVFNNQTNNLGINVVIKEIYFNDNEIDELIKLNLFKKIKLFNTTSSGYINYNYNFNDGDIILVDLIPNGNNVGVNLANSSNSNGFKLIRSSNTILLKQVFKVIGNNWNYCNIFIDRPNDNTNPVKCNFYILNTNLIDYFNLSVFKKINTNITKRNYDLPIRLNKNIKIKYNIITNGNTINLTLSNTYPANNSSIYKSLYNSNEDVQNGEFQIDKEYECIHIFNNQTNNLGINIELELIDVEFSNKKIAIFGDSITSSYITNIGGLINNYLGTQLIGNFAHGNASLQNWQNENGQDITPITFDTINNSDTADNVLSNQILRLLQHTTALGEQIKWRDYSNNEYTVPTSVGTGLGHTDDIPDIIYIAIGTNDGKPHGTNNFVNTPVIDDTPQSFVYAYRHLNKITMVQALRWAIETLRFNYPNAEIFVATPLFTNYSYDDPDNIYNQAFSGKYEMIKRDIIIKTCEFESVKLIDSQSESGYSRMVAITNGQIHPNEKWANNIARYVVDQIKNRYTQYLNN